MNKFNVLENNVVNVVWVKWASENITGRGSKYTHILSLTRQHPARQEFKTWLFTQGIVLRVTNGIPSFDACDSAYLSMFLLKWV